MPSTLLSMLAQRRPEALAEQLARCGELIGAELAESAARWQRRLAWQAAAGAFALLALMLGGTAALLAALPTLADAALPSAFWAVPGGAAVLALLCGLAAGPAPAGPRLAQLQARLAEAVEPAADGASGTASPASAPDALSAVGALAADAGREALRPFARQHPVALVTLAAAGGALLVVTRPWRLLASPEVSRLGVRLGGRWLERQGGALIAELLTAAPAGRPDPGR